MKKKKIILIDLGSNNIFSIYNALSLFSSVTVIKEYDKKIQKCDFDILVIPGVGSFQSAMSILESRNLIKLIKDSFYLNKKILGICLGFQLFFTKSYEFGINKGLNLINGEIVSFREKANFITNIGWSKLSFDNFSDSYFKNLLDKKFFYHIHSYFLETDLNNISLTYTSKNDFTFTSSVLYKNIMGLQFHPEKSGKNGLNFLNSYINYDA